MKTVKVCFVLLLLCALPGLKTVAQDQETILRAERINKQDLPPEVVAAYMQKFPTANLTQIMKLPPAVFKREWLIEEQNTPSPNDQYYTLSMTGKGVDIEAVYDAQGNLIRASERARDVTLPVKIDDYIGNHYEGFRILKDKVRRLITPTKIKAEWEVLIVKGNDIRRLFFNKDGDFLKERR
ncbi:hypothetical protein [Chitinophaga flava]|uniref:Beta-lactamase-inhibitor-like PepSY-like domain-containing protein n=1 Tax=Chitinophaga flava TaxID=2259036 RepID=A0A365XYY2_9BACT|nr:hypothetical protein [Chitinophaga flava]RBL91450.1 hypothetical protein DF182_02200 [Chitinophaga flava]